MTGRGAAAAAAVAPATMAAAAMRNLTIANLMTYVIGPIPGIARPTRRPTERRRRIGAFAAPRSKSVVVRLEPHDHQIRPLCAPPGSGPGLDRRGRPRPGGRGGRRR